jgi:hypothetical protein
VVAGRRHGRPELGVIVGIADRDEDVDDRLGGQTRDGRRADVPDGRRRRRTQGGGDAPPVVFELGRPGLVVVDDDEVGRFTAADQVGVEHGIEVGGLGPAPG